MILGPLWHTNLLTFIRLESMMSGRLVEFRTLCSQFWLHCWKVLLDPSSQWHNLLVGAFNPFQNYYSKWESSPDRGEHKSLWNHHLVVYCFYQACWRQAGPPAEAGYAATEGAPDLVHRRLWCGLTGCFPQLWFCGERQQEQEQGGDLYFWGNQKVNLKIGTT